MISEKNEDHIQFELFFAAHPCGYSSVKCGNDLQCVYRYELCDGVKHCLNGYDEDDDMCKG